MNSTPLIPFVYQNCTQEELENREVSFRQDEFESMIYDKCMSTQVPVTSMHVVIRRDEGHPGQEYQCKITIKSPELGNSDVVETAGMDPAQVTRQAIHNVQKLIYKAKDRNHTH